MDENGVWFENRNSDQQFHHIYQISDDQVNVFELDTFIIGNSSDFNIIDTRIIISNNRIIALVDAISTNFVSFSVTELDAYHFAAYVLGKNKIDRIILHENSVDYLDMKDIMYEQDIPVIIFRHSNSGNTVYNIYRFTDDILVKDEDLENKLSTIKNDLQANRIGGFYRSDAVITIWEKFNELESNHFVLYFFADDQYFATLNLTKYFGEGHVSQSLWHLGLPQTIELGNTNNIIMTNFSRHYLVSIDGYDVGIERMEFLLDGSFSAFGMGKMDRSIIYWGVLLENGEGNGVNEILIGYEIDALNLAASLALRNPLELYGFPSVVYTTIITVVYIYKKRHIQIVDETYPRMRKDD